MKVFGVTMMIIGFLWLQRWLLECFALTAEQTHRAARGAPLGRRGPLDRASTRLPFRLESTDTGERAVFGPRATTVFTQLALVPHRACWVGLPVVRSSRFGLRSLPRSSEYVAGWKQAFAGSRRTLIDRNP